MQEQRNRGAVDDKMFTRESFCKAQTESIDSNKKNKYTNTQIQVQIQMQVHKKIYKEIILLTTSHDFTDSLHQIASSE